MLSTRALAAHLILCAAALAPAARAFELSALPSPLSKTQLSVDLRLRAEEVDLRAGPATADAFLGRLRLGLLTPAFYGLSGFAEYEGVGAVGNHEFNSTRNGRTRYAVIADPIGQELNQGWVRYSGLPATTLTYGRQKLVLDNARFIGDSGWRMNQQTFDGTVLVNQGLAHTTLTAAYLTNIDSFTATNIPLHATVLHARNDAQHWFAVSGYAYLFDFVANTAARRDTATFGVRATGNGTVQGFKLGYALEAARQRHYEQAPRTIGARYLLAEGSVGFADWGWLKTPSIKGGVELLGGDGNYGFQTPLATLHAFQGWADQFLATPGNGIEDFYTGVGATLEKVALQALWHDYHADAVAQHYGHEWNLQATRPLARGVTLGLKFADYDAERFSVDTRKGWVWLDFKF